MDEGKAYISRKSYGLPSDNMATKARKASDISKRLRKATKELEESILKDLKSEFRKGIWANLDAKSRRELEMATERSFKRTIRLLRKMDSTLEAEL